MLEVKESRLFWQVQGEAPEWLERPALMRRLDEVLAARLALVTAPAGFGKTMLLQQWAQRLERPAAWMVLDAADNDRVVFLIHLLTALRSAWPELTDSVLSMPAAMLTVEAAALALLNALSKCEEPCVVVLDRCEIVQSEEVQRLLVLLIENQPPMVHWVMAGRELPAWSVLPRLRVRRELVELNARDLRLSPAEVTELVNGCWGMGLSRADLKTLAERTEGWMMGVRLLLAAPEGPSPALTEYFAREVFLPQSKFIQAFLLKTACLEQLNGPLCDAVAGTVDGWRLLEQVERLQLFILPRDEERRWYRYHPLFGEFLRRERARQMPVGACVAAVEPGFTLSGEYT